MTERSVRVLCVDDEPGLAELVATFLERDADLDCETAVETDPDAALARIREEPFDCVVTDYDMPARTGVELLSAARETHPELPFLLFSATGPDELAAEMVRVGVTDYVRKRGGSDAYTTLIRRVDYAIDGEDGSFDGPDTAVGSADASHSLAVDDVDARVSFDAVCTVSPDGTFEYVDEAYARAYGYDPETLVGEPWQRLHPDDEVEHIRTNVLPAVMEGDRWTGRSTGVRADGNMFPESKLVSTTSDGRLLISVSAVDGGSDGDADSGGSAVSDGDGNSGGSAVSDGDGNSGGSALSDATRADD